jgi:hypothetical protein
MKETTILFKLLGTIGKSLKETTQDSCSHIQDSTVTPKIEMDSLGFVRNQVATTLSIQVIPD